MNEINLSRRLETVAKYIPNEAVFADIGSDHAYLPCYAIIKGIASSAIAGEVVEGPYQSALKQVRKTGLQEKIAVRKGDGLEVISPNEVTCITIAGMGGALITSIIESGKAKLEGVDRLVLQPNVNARSIREWLYENSWELTNEEILEEDGKIYEVLVAERAYGQHTILDAELLLGPFLMKEKNQVFMKKWSLEAKHWQTILDNLEKAPKSHENLQKKAQLMQQLQYVKGVLENE